ncbi:MAG: SirB1 family protein [Anaerolineales bacterium]
MMNMTFTEFVTLPGFRLEYAALLLAKDVAYPNMDIEVYIQRLDEISAVVAGRVHPRDEPLDIIKRLNQYLFEEQGYQGNRENYYDPRNSFLNDVITRHTGIPITLSVLYITLARRLGVPLFGVGLPGHFVTGYQVANCQVYLDPFHEGLILSDEECLHIAAHYLSSGAGLPRHLLAPVSNQDILWRMLTNLRQIYIAQVDSTRLLRVLCLQSALRPDDVELRRDIGALSVQQENWGQAVRTLRTYFYQRPQAEDIDNVRALLDQALTHLSRLN